MEEIGAYILSLVEALTLTISTLALFMSGWAAWGRWRGTEEQKRFREANLDVKLLSS